MTFVFNIILFSSTGIGFEFIKQLLALTPPPKNVIATTRSESAELTKLVSNNSGLLHVVKYDASAFDTYQQFAKQVHEIVGEEGIDLLVNNAGIYVRGNLETITSEGMVNNFEVNAVAPLMLTKALLPLLKVCLRGLR